MTAGRCTAQIESRHLMCSRAIAFLLAAVLLWSGFTTHEQALAIALHQAEHAEMEPAAASAFGSGSVGDRHIDDFPAQAHVETLADLQVLLAEHPNAASPFLVMARPRPWPMGVLAAPYLDGPQRPPCTTLIHA